MNLSGRFSSTSFEASKKLSVHALMKKNAPLPIKVIFLTPKNDYTQLLKKDEDERVCRQEMARPDKDP
jgi:hypothetical protein